MQKGKFFSVGVGPGDPKLLTIKAVEIISFCDCICAPKSAENKSVALNIATEYLIGKEVVLCDMPMTKDSARLEESHNIVAENIAGMLDCGKNVAFLTLGDPTIYATTMYIQKKLENRGFEVEIISGITSFCAAAGRLNVSLCETDEALHILPASYGDVLDGMSLKGTKVLMKSGKQINAVRDMISGFSESHDIRAVECVTMDCERVFQSLDEIPGDLGYFTLVVAKEKST